MNMAPIANFWRVARERIPYLTRGIFARVPWCGQCPGTLSLAHTHTHTHSLTHSLSHTHTLSHTLSRSPEPVHSDNFEGVECRVEVLVDAHEREVEPARQLQSLPLNQHASVIA